MEVINIKSRHHCDTSRVKMKEVACEIELTLDLQVAAVQTSCSLV